MNEEERANRINQVTQGVLKRILLKPDVLIAMEINMITPEAVGQMVKDILEYLDKTKAEA